MIESGDSNMTPEFITRALSALDESENTWTSLFGKVKRIALLADNNISVDPRYRLFYFDDDTEMLYITYYDGTMIRYNEGDEIPENYTIMTINGTSYLNKISKNYVIYNIDGVDCKIHAAISYDKIVGFYNPTVSAQAYIDELKGY